MPVSLSHNTRQKLLRLWNYSQSEIWNTMSSAGGGTFEDRRSDSERCNFWELTASLSSDCLHDRTKPARLWLTSYFSVVLSLSYIYDRFRQLSFLLFWSLFTTSLWQSSGSTKFNNTTLNQQKVMTHLSGKTTPKFILGLLNKAMLKITVFINKNVSLWFELQQEEALVPLN